MNGTVQGGVSILLRAEGLLLLGVSALGWSQLSGDWRLFALLFLLPDLSMLGYVAGRHVGAALYNAAHSLVTPLGLGAALWSLGQETLLPLLLIWTAHIGFDRALGYGLKYGQGFGFTHLGLIGKAARETAT